MASILKVGDKWRALVRRKGHRAQCKTFPTKAAAQVWAREVEGRIDSGQAPATATTLTLGQVLSAYRELRESSRAISDSSNEHYMLKRLAEGLADKRAGIMTPQDLVDYCRMRRGLISQCHTLTPAISQ